MVKLRPQILKKNGRSEFVILSYREYQAIRELLEDAEDLRALQEAREADDPAAPGYSLEQVRVRLGLRAPRKARRRAARRR